MFKVLEHLPYIFSVQFLSALATAVLVKSCAVFIENIIMECEYTAVFWIHDHQIDIPQFGIVALEINVV